MGTVTERLSPGHEWDLPPEPIEIVAGAVQLRPWEDRLAAELAALTGKPEPDGVPRRLREWREGAALSFAVQEITTARLLGEVVLRPRPDGTASLIRRAFPADAAPVARAAAVVERWARGALGATQVEMVDQ
jgi:hypothetical protein